MTRAGLKTCATTTAGLKPCATTAACLRTCATTIHVSDDFRSDNRGAGSGVPLPADMADALRRARPRLEHLGERCLYFPVVGSTNDVASELLAAGDTEGVVVIADQQTFGRGRRGHSWFSPPASGLYVSVVLTPARARVDPARATGLLTLAAGVALAEAIEFASGLRVDLKWPNDLFVARRKLGGILAESGGMASVVLGYGVNLETAAFPPELADRATSLESEVGKRVDRTALLVETLAAVGRRYGDLLDGRYDAILDAWRERAPSAIGTRVQWSTSAGQQSGVTAGIDARGALQVQVGDRVERIVSGELVWS